jgi:hypothetical protein
LPTPPCPLPPAPTLRPQTTVINHFLGRFSTETMATKTITFSSLTTPQIFQLSIEGAVEKRQGRTYGPPGGRTMCVFVDDISMPAINNWGDQVRRLGEGCGASRLPARSARPPAAPLPISQLPSTPCPPPRAPAAPCTARSPTK